MIQDMDEVQGSLSILELPHKFVLILYSIPCLNASSETVSGYALICMMAIDRVAK